MLYSLLQVCRGRAMHMVTCGSSMIWKAYKRGGVLTEEDLQDSTLRENDTQITTDQFKNLVNFYAKDWQQKNKDIKTKQIRKKVGCCRWKTETVENEAPWHDIVRRAIFTTFWFDLAYSSLFAFIAEAITVTYVYFLYFLFEFIKDTSIDYKQGILLICVYGTAVIVSCLARNYYMFLGYIMAIRLRKAVVSAMYDKVGKLSNKSLTETNSGKLITIISGDIFNVERAICILPILPAAPFVTLLSVLHLQKQWH